MEKPISPSPHEISVTQWYEASLSGPVPNVTVPLNGVSMLPLIRRGIDPVTVTRLYRPLKKGDVVLFRRHDGVFAVHRVRRLRGNTVVTLGDGCLTEDPPMTSDRVCGIVIRVCRNGRSISLDGPTGRFFGRLWMAALPLRRFLRLLRRPFAFIKHRVLGK